MHRSMRPLNNKYAKQSKNAVALKLFALLLAAPSTATPQTAVAATKATGPFIGTYLGTSRGSENSILVLGRRHPRSL